MRAEESLGVFLNGRSSAKQRRIAAVNRVYVKPRIFRLGYAASLAQIGRIVQTGHHFQVISLGYGHILMKHRKLQQVHHFYQWQTAESTYFHYE